MKKFVFLLILAILVPMLSFGATTKKSKSSKKHAKTKLVAPQKSIQVIHQVKPGLWTDR